MTTTKKMIRTTDVNRVTVIPDLSIMINQASDRLATIIDQLDKKLSALNLGVSCWYHYNPKKAVGYTKLPSGWRLALTSGDQIWRYNDAPRHLRIQAAEFLKDLIDEINRNTKVTIDEIDTAIGYVQMALSKVR